MTDTTRAANRADVRRARRASFAAAVTHGSALCASVFGPPAPPEVLEELEIRARLERVVYSALRRRPAHR